MSAGRAERVQTGFRFDAEHLPLGLFVEDRTVDR